MRFLNKLFKQDEDKPGPPRDPGLTLQAEEYVQRAEVIAEQEIRQVFAGDHWVVSALVGTYMKIQAELQRAVELCPAVPEYRYMLAWSKIHVGLGKDGSDEINRLALDFPSFIEAQGFSRASSLGLPWWSPFYYPRWNATARTLPSGLVPADTGSCLPVTMLSSGCRRIVSFVGNLRRRSLGPSFRPDLRTTLRLNYMDTPAATIVGVYVLIDTDPREPYTSEQLINIESYFADSKNTSDFSRVGFYLMQLLASQPYTYIVINDPEEGVFFNRKLEISGELGLHLADVAAKVRNVRLRQNDDVSVFVQSQQYYFHHFSVDNVHF